ncbi:MAG: choice-of-anchor L domain-containing protein [Rhodoluna sp.]|nr:choice-of-anchor L domain-containing protein [Rhodoluna sp.]
MRTRRIGLLAPLLLVSLFSPVQAHAATATIPNGIQTTDLNSVGTTPLSLATELVGTGVTISNVLYKGSNAQAGTIDVVDPQVVAFNRGVILSTGSIADVVGPNKSESITGEMAGFNDADLDALIENSETVNPVTFDAASLEFDFVPTTNEVYFSYVFGSEEYLEWVNLYDDVFAFYVNGVNCATVPGVGNTAVSIDTINSTVNSNLYRDNSYLNPPSNPINIESDGLSVEMICSATVTPNQTNHIKLAIADTSDQVLDSIVMVKSGSFSTVKPESCNNGIDDDADNKIDIVDPQCSSSITPAPLGQSGIGQAGDPPAFTGIAKSPIKLDASTLGWEPNENTISTSWEVHGINGNDAVCQIVPSGNQGLKQDRSIALAAAICPTAGEYVARIDGWDSEGNSDFDYDVDFFVQAAAAEIHITPLPQDNFPAPGETVTITAEISNIVDGEDVLCKYNWGDGTKNEVNSVQGVCTESHVYAINTSAVISVIAVTADGVSAADLVQIIIGETVKPLDKLFEITGPPVILGTVKVGTALTSTPGTWSPLPTYSYKWFKYKTLADTPVQVGTANTYIAQPADLGFSFILKVFGNKTGYTQGESTSLAKTVVAGSQVKTPMPKITGTFKVGKTLTALPGAWDAGVTKTYQWLKDGKAISKATAVTYKPVAKDKGHNLSVKITVKNTGYTTVSKTSTATKVT